MTASYRCETHGISLPLRYSRRKELRNCLGRRPVNILVGTDSLAEGGKSNSNNNNTQRSS
jgi:hypothetical protein